MTIIPKKVKKTPSGSDLERCSEYAFKRQRRVISRRRQYTISAKITSSEITGAATNATYRYKQSLSTSDLESLSTSDLEIYAGDSISSQKRSFRETLASGDLLSWSKDLIKKPVIVATEKSLKRDTCELFKFIQKYTHNPKLKNRKSMEEIALYIATKCWTNQTLCDEFYIKICHQTGDNSRRENVILGWELMAICLSLFPPSAKLLPSLRSYLTHNMDNWNTSEWMIGKFAAVCQKRLERMIQRGPKGLQMPTFENIYQSRIQIYRPSMFGNTLDEVMELQKSKYPDRRLPWIQTALSELVLGLNGQKTEGVFRVSGDLNDVNKMKAYVDQWQILECADPHVPASLLKMWYRELYEPLIPNQFYNACIEYCNDAAAALHIVQKLPEINRLVLFYLIRFLQVFAAAENATVTKMDASNLAMVMAPNCLRCACDDPLIVFQNSRKEMAFLYNLIQYLDTSFIEGIM